MTAFVRGEVDWPTARFGWPRSSLPAAAPPLASPSHSRTWRTAWRTRRGFSPLLVRHDLARPQDDQAPSHGAEITPAITRGIADGVQDVIDELPRLRDLFRETEALATRLDFASLRALRRRGPWIRTSCSASTRSSLVC
jgi:hypothetical protein